MILRQESLPQANIYSSKILFDQMEDRNKKRMNQILRRKKALSTKNKTVKYDEEKSNISPKREKEESNINILNQFSQSISNINPINEDYPKNKVELKNSINDINNNSTNYNSSILNKYSQEKEVNVSNIEGDNTELFISNQNLTQNINNKNSTPNIFKNNKSIINIDIINCDESFNEENKDNSNYFDSNEFAIKYLSSSSDSFIKLDNHLVAKAKFQNNCFTDSYSQALEMNYNDNSITYKTLFSRNYLVTEIIKEEREREGETPLKRKTKKEKEKNKNKNVNDEEKEIMKRIERRRAYSKRIRNNALNKNVKDELGINPNINKKIAVKVMNKSKSCKRLITNDIMNKECKNICIYKKNDIKKNSFYIKRKKNQDEINNKYLNNTGRRTVYNINKKLSLNNSFNYLSKNDKNKKIITAMNSSKNLKINNNKNEKPYKGISTNRSNLNIFKNNLIAKNKNNLNISMNNLYPKLIRKDKLRKSKSAKKIHDYSKNSFLNNNNHNINGNNKFMTNEKLSMKLKKMNIITNNNNINANSNNNKTLKKNPTMGRLTFIKKTNINKKDEVSKCECLNKTVVITSNKIDSSVLNKTISYKNIKYKNNNNCNCNNLNSRNSIPLKIKTKKTVKNIANTGNKAVNKLKMNKSFCYLNKKDKDKNS